MFNKSKTPDSLGISRLTPADIRSMERGNRAAGRRTLNIDTLLQRLPSKKSVLAGAAATAAVVGVGMMKEGDQAVADARTDAANQETVVAQNPEIFGTPESTTVTIEQTLPYQVEPGDNAWNMGTRVEANVDGIAGNEDVRPYVDAIQAQAGPDGIFQINDIVQVPAAADRHQDPGVQLSSK